MFDLRHAIIGAAVSCGIATRAVALAAPHPDAAHDSARREVARLDSIRVLRRLSYDSLRQALLGRETWVDVNAGVFHVRATAALANAVRAAALEATAAVSRRGGEALRERLAGHLPVVGADTLHALIGRKWVVWLAPDTGRHEWERTRFMTLSRPAAPEIADHLVGLAERVALEGADSTLGAWLMLQHVPLHEAPRSDWAVAYRELAIMRSLVLRRCRAGDDAACLSAVGIRPALPNRLDAWFDSTDYRDLLGMVAVPRGDSAAVAAAPRCRRDGDTAACAVAARAIPDASLPLPASALARRLFLDEVLRSGGANAYARLMAARGSMEERLTLAAAMPLDRVVASWRSRVNAARTEPMRFGASTGLFTLAWCGAFIGIAVARRALWT